MITKTLKTGLFFVALASFSLVGAQEKLEVKEDKSAKMFKHLDANADGEITLEEYKAKLLKDDSKTDQIEKRFAKIDTNENGTLDREEFKVAMDAPRGAKKKAKKKTIEKVD